MRLIFTIIALITVIIFLWYKIDIKEPVLDDNLTFSNTAKWGEVYLDALSSQQILFPVSLKKSIHLPPPPANSSVQTEKELNLLLEYKKLRTEETLATILAESESLDGIYFGDYTFGEYKTSLAFPQTALLLKQVFKDVFVTILFFKEEFDRVRPSILSPALDPVITVPSHPAYPSGHSTQAHFIAYFLAELMPEKRAEFEEVALRVAIHREIAGLHYPSDTAAGALLAREYLEALKLNPEFNKLFLLAKEEWRK